MAGLRTASTWVKIALVTLILAIVLFVVGFATLAWMVLEWYPGQRHSWGDTSYRGFGLWRQKLCSRRTGQCWEAENRSQAVWFQAGQAMECLGLIFMAIALILLFLYTCVNSMKRRNPLLGVIFTTFAAVLFMAIGFAIFIGKFGERGFEMSWSLGLAIAAAGCALISGIMSLIEFCSSR